MRLGRYAGQGSGVSVLPSRVLQAFAALIKAYPQSYRHREHRFFLRTVVRRQQSCRNSVAVIVSYAFSGTGAQMIIDLDSWEAGYADGRLGCGPACPENRDEVSYSSGYREGRATRAGVRMKPPRLRHLQRRKGAFDPVG